MIRSLLILSSAMTLFSAHGTDQSMEEGDRVVNPKHLQVIRHITSEQEKASLRKVDFEAYRKSIKRLGEFKDLSYKVAKNPLKWTVKELSIIIASLTPRDEQNSLIMPYKKRFVEVTSTKLCHGYTLPHGINLTISRAISNPLASHYNGLISFSDDERPVSFKVMVVKIQLEKKSKKQQDKVPFQREIEKKTKSHRRLSITDQEELVSLAHIEEKIEAHKLESRQVSWTQDTDFAPKSSPKLKSTQSSPNIDQLIDSLYDEEDKKDQKAQRLKKQNRSKSVTSFKSTQELRAAQGKVLIKQASSRTLKRPTGENQPSPKPEKSAQSREEDKK